jgi:hypothetical protein
LDTPTGSVFFDAQLATEEILSYNVYTEHDELLATIDGCKKPIQTVQPPRPTVLRVAAYCFASFQVPHHVTQVLLEATVMLMTRSLGAVPDMKQVLGQLLDLIKPGHDKSTPKDAHGYSTYHDPPPQKTNQYPQPESKLDKDFRLDPLTPFCDTDEDCFTTLFSRVQEVYGTAHQWLDFNRLTEEDPNDIVFDNRMLFHLLRYMIQPEASTRLWGPPRLYYTWYVLVIAEQSRGFWSGLSEQIDVQQLQITEILGVSCCGAYVTYTSVVSIEKQLTIINATINPFVIITDRRRVAGPTLPGDNMPMDQKVKNFIYPYWLGTSYRTMTVSPSDERGVCLKKIPLITATPSERNRMKEIRSVFMKLYDTRFNASGECSRANVVRLCAKQPFIPAELVRYRAEVFDEQHLAVLPLQSLARLVHDIIGVMELPVFENDNAFWWIDLSIEFGLPMARAMVATACIRLHAFLRLCSTFETLGNDTVS